MYRQLGMGCKSSGGLRCSGQFGLLTPFESHVRKAGGLRPRKVQEFASITFSTLDRAQKWLPFSAMVIQTGPSCLISELDLQGAVDWLIFGQGWAEPFSPSPHSEPLS